MPVDAYISIIVNEKIHQRKAVRNWKTRCVIGNMENISPSRYSKIHDERITSDNYTCKISWYSSVDEIISPQSDGLYSHTRYLLNTLDSSDIVITVNDENIPAHKFILTLQSPVFAKMFQTNMIESATNRVDVKDIDIDIMIKVIEFMYTGQLDETYNVNILLAILAAAEKYQIIDLKYLCGHLLTTKITIDNALRIFEYANLYDLYQLIEVTIIFMVKNKLELTNQEDFKSLYSKKPEIFLEFIMRMAIE